MGEPMSDDACPNCGESECESAECLAATQRPLTAEELADARERYELSKLRPEQQEDYDRGDDR